MRAAFIAAAIITTLLASGGSVASSFQGNSPSAHVTWVAESLRKMETIKPGMTRADLLAVFTTEGGLFNRTTRTYVSQDCPLFKVDVRFRAVGDAGTAESSADVVATISRPYLQRPVMD